MKAHFYHSRASARLRSNQIKVVESGGSRYFTHMEKERVFTNYYRDILGKSFTPQHLIDLEAVYPNSLDLTSLSVPFSEQKILQSLKLIPRDKSPVPDGFGSAYYQDFWALIMLDIINIFSQFYNNHAKLDRNNRSYIVLIKKKDNSCTSDAYCPISLLNCPVKLVTKVLALRMQSMLPKLIDEGQTGFVCLR
jgi:hypothetical protein